MTASTTLHARKATVSASNQAALRELARWAWNRGFRRRRFETDAYGRHWHFGSDIRQGGFFIDHRPGPGGDDWSVELWNGLERVELTNADPERFLTAAALIGVGAERQAHR